MAALTAAALAAAGIGSKVLPWLLKGGKYAKMAYKSKRFLPGLGYGVLGVGMLGGMYGQAGERGLSKEQLRIQTLIQKASAEATKTSVKESRANTKKYIDALMKAQREERAEVRDIEAMRSFTASQDRQMALVLQAVQAIGQRQPGAGGGGMLGLMRGGF